MAFLQRLAESFKEGLVTLTNVAEAPRRNEVPPRTLTKQSSKGKSRPSSASFGFLESHIRDAIAAFVQDKFDKGEAKPHVFTQFWLQFPKLEAGFEVLRRQLELRTGSREGPLPLTLLQSSPQDFGIHNSSMVVRELCSKAVSHKFTDVNEIDFVGLVMLLLVVHLTELSDPDASLHLHPDVRIMLSCLELAFTHFNSARKGKLDKREVAEALQYEAAKAHKKEGARARTSNRLAHRLFEGLDWEHDNTISFENFLRGILQLVQDEFGDVPDEDEDIDEELMVSVATAPAGSGPATPTHPPVPVEADAGSAVRSSGPRRCGSSRAGSASQREGSCCRPRSNSATGLVSVEPPQGVQLESSGRSPSGFLATLKGSFRKSSDMLNLKGAEPALSSPPPPAPPLSPKAAEAEAPSAAVAATGASVGAGLAKAD